MTTTTTPDTPLFDYAAAREAALSRRYAEWIAAAETGVGVEEAYTEMKADAERLTTGRRRASTGGNATLSVSAARSNAETGGQP